MVLMTVQLARDASWYLKSSTPPRLYLVERSLALAESELIQEPKNELAVLEYVLGSMCSIVSWAV